MSKTSKLRCGIIGGGAIGASHVIGFRTHPLGEVVAVAEIDDTRRDDFVKAHNLEAGYKDYHELLARKDIDVVSIGLPNFLHAQVSIEALESGKHVLLEKPMATNYPDAKRVYDTAVAKGLKIMVGQNFRFMAQNQALAGIVASGRLGRIYHMKTSWLRRTGGIPRIGSWFTQKKFSGGGCSYDIGVHALDVGLGIINNFEPVSVSAKVYAEFGPRGLGDGGWGKSEIDPSKPFDVEDFSFALIKMKDGTTVQLESSWALHIPEGNQSGVQVFGTEGGATSTPFQVYYQDGEDYVVTQPKIGTPKVKTDRMAHFLDVVSGECEPLVKPEESLVVQQILDAIYESSSTGREVLIKS